MTLPERAKEVLEKIEGIEADLREFDGDKRGIAHNLGYAEEELAELSRPMARAVLAAEELAAAIEGEILLGENPASSRDSRLNAALATDAALKAYRQTTGDQSSTDLNPGTFAARQQGCVCSGKGEQYRDGWGWEVSPDCPLHKDMQELGE